MKLVAFMPRTSGHHPRLHFFNTSMRQDLHHPATQPPPSSSTWSKLTRRTAALSCVLALAACGGGGDDKATEGPPPATGATLVAPAAQTLQLDHAATAGTLSGSFAVQFQGNASPAWTARSDQNWLLLSEASGSGVGAFTYAVDTSKLGDLPNWGSAVANVSISANGASVTTTLTLDKRMPEITMVWPNAVAAGQAGTVRVLGRGLSQLAGASGIQVEGGNGVTGTIVSDTEARLNLPVLVRGRHAISVPSRLGVEGTVASLAAVDPSVLPPSFTSRYIGQSSFLFDASRQAWFGFTGGSTLNRWVFDGAQWVQGSVALPGELSSQTNAVWLALTPDRRSVYGYANNQLLAVDPDTLAIQQAYPLPSEWLGTSRSVQPAGITHDMRLWFTLFKNDNNTTSTHFLAYFDLRTQRFETVQGGPTITTDLAIGAARDGSRLVGVRSSEGSGNFVYRAATSTFADMPPLPTSDSMVLTDVGPDGTTFMVGNLHLYSFQEGANLVLKGSLPSAGMFNRSILSPDGSRVYALSTSGATTNVEGFTATVLDRIAVFDATTTAAALRPLGTFDLPEPITECKGAILIGGCRHGSLQISPLGDTLFWPTFERFLVVPVPVNL
jgi:hypothetical protein